MDWTITDLGSLGGTETFAYGINNRGQVVGTSSLSGDSAYYAFLHDGTGLRALPTLGGTSGTAYGINARGHVVGESSLGDGTPHAFLYDSTGVYDLGTLSGGRYSAAFGINASGQVVGQSEMGFDTPNGIELRQRAFLSDGAGMRDLGTLSGGRGSQAYAINNSGQVVGQSELSLGPDTFATYAFLSDGAGMVPLVPGVAYGINVHGHVVGYSTAGAFLYDGMRMHTLGGYVAYGINARGQVVGADTAGQPFLYEGGAMRNLSALPEVVAAGWQSLGEDPSAINDSGQISGTGLRGSQTRAFRLHPQTTSRYMRTVDTVTLFNLGCAQTNQSGLLILDFGQPWVRNGIYGTIYPGTRRFASIADIENAVRFFLNGYYGCRGTGSMTVAVGTNNFGINTTYAHGQAWGRMVARLNNYISRPTADLRNRLAVVGASDIEMDYSPPVRSRRWVDGYASTSPVMYYNYGDAAGCPQCNNGWTLEDVWYVSWGNAARPLPVPQIYHTGGTQTRHWQAVTTYGRNTHGTEAFIPAALTQWQACRDPNRNCHPTIRNTPVQAWYQLMNMLHGVVGDPTRVQNILYSSDITWQN